MNKNDLFVLQYMAPNEENLKIVLKNICNESGINNAFISLMYKNQLLLNSCNIDEKSFNYILLRNYVFFLNNENDLTFKNASERDTKIINNFNHYIENNSIKKALELYQNHYIIYQLLCSAYMKNLYKTESEKIGLIPDDKIDTVYKKVKTLKNKDLSFVREQEKNIKTRISNR